MNILLIQAIQVDRGDMVKAVGDVIHGCGGAMGGQGTGKILALKIGDYIPVGH
jgi:hypothetical protein